MYKDNEKIILKKFNFNVQVKKIIFKKLAN